VQNHVPIFLRTSFHSSASREEIRGGGATHLSSGSYIMPSTPSTCMTSGLRPWVQNVQSLGLSIALTYFHDLPATQLSFSSCSAPSFARSNDIACTMDHKKLDHSLILCPRLYYTSFPLHGSVPISWLGLGTKFQNGNEAECLNLSPEYQISTCVTVGSTEFVDERNLVSISTCSSVSYYVSLYVRSLTG
jgi:exportin-5